MALRINAVDPHSNGSKPSIEMCTHGLTERSDNPGKAYKRKQKHSKNEAENTYPRVTSDKNWSRKPRSKTRERYGLTQGQENFLDIKPRGSNQLSKLK